jgi:hypothetical protein
MAAPPAASGPAAAVLFGLLSATHPAIADLFFEMVWHG